MGYGLYSVQLDPSKIRQFASMGSGI